MDEDEASDFVQGAYTFADKLYENSEAPMYISNTAGGRPWVSMCLTLCANVVHAFAEAAEIELLGPETRSPTADPPGLPQRLRPSRAQRKPPGA